MTDLAQIATAVAALARLVPGGATLVGIGWATVDTERLLADLATTADLRFGPEVDEPTLGARARVAWSGGTAIVVLEPSTEGRLAAALARRGEGIACLYVAGAAASGAPRLTALGRRGRVLTHERPWGPFMILVDPDR